MTVKATRASSLVLSNLDGRPRQGRVHSCYRRTVNVLCDDMTWLSLHPPDVPLDAYCIAVDAGSSPCGDGFLGARPGERASVSHDWITLGDDGASIDLADTAVWQSGLDPVGDLDPADVVRIGRTLKELVGGMPTESWFLGVMGRRRRTREGSIELVMRGKILRALSQLKDSWISGGLGRTLEAMEWIMGFGPGLTPAGDDFLTGFLGASYCLAHDDRFREAVFCNIASPLGRTSLPAFFMLKAALAGHYPEPLANVLRSLTGGDTEVLRAAVEGLSGLGSTSGDDMLAGILAWFEAAGLSGVTHEAHCH
jgi:hypothetical protein